MQVEVGKVLSASMQKLEKQGVPHTTYVCCMWQCTLSRLLRCHDIMLKFDSMLWYMLIHLWQAIPVCPPGRILESAYRYDLPSLPPGRILEALIGMIYQSITCNSPVAVMYAGAMFADASTRMR